MKDKQKSKAYKKPATYSKKTVISLVFSIIICLMFLASGIVCVPVEKEECISLKVTFDYCEYIRGIKSPDRGMHLYFTDAPSYYVEDYCLGYGLQEDIEGLTEGTVLSLSVYEEYGEIVELSTEEESLFSFEDYKERTEKEQKYIFVWFFISLLLPVTAIVNMIREKNKYKPKKR